MPDKPTAIKIGQHWKYNDREFVIEHEGSVNRVFEGWTFKWIDDPTNLTWDYERSILDNKSYVFLRDSGDQQMEKPQNIKPGQVWRREGNETIIQHVGTPTNHADKSYVTFDIPGSNVKDGYESVTYIKDAGGWEFVTEQFVPGSLQPGQTFLYNGKPIVLLRKTLSSESDYSYWRWAYADNLSDIHVDSEESLLARDASYIYLRNNPVKPTNLRVGQTFRYGSTTLTIVKKGTTTNDKAASCWTFDNNAWSDVRQILGDEFVFIGEKALPKPSTIRPGQVWSYSGVDFVVKSRTTGKDGKEAWTFDGETGYELSEKMLYDTSWQLVEERPIKIKPGQKWMLSGQKIVIKRSGSVADASKKDAWVYVYDGAEGEVWAEETVFLTDTRFQLIEDLPSNRPSTIQVGQTWEAQGNTFYVSAVSGEVIILVNTKSREELAVYATNIIKSQDYEFVSAPLAKPDKRQHNQHWFYQGQEIILTKRKGSTWTYKFVQDGREGQVTDENLGNHQDYQFAAEVVKPTEVVPGQRWLYSGKEIIITRPGSSSDSGKAGAHTWMCVGSYETGWSYDSNVKEGFEFLAAAPTKPAVAARQLWSIDNKTCSITRIEDGIAYFKYVGSTSEYSRYVTDFTRDNYYYIGADWALPKPSQIKSGQVWQNGSYKYTIMHAGNSNGTAREGYWTLDDGSVYAATDILQGSGWILISEKPLACKVGQVWKKDNKEYAVFKDLGGTRKSVELDNGAIMYEADILDASKGWTFVRQQLPKPRVAIGQIWRLDGKEIVIRRAGTVANKTEPNTWVFSYKNNENKDAWDFNDKFSGSRYEFVGVVEKTKTLSVNQVFACDGKPIVLKEKTTSADGHVIWKFDDGSWDFEQNILTNNRYVFVLANNISTEEKPVVADLSEVQIAAQKQTVIANTIELLSSNDVVYGDYVRDMLAQDGINEADIFLYSDTVNWSWGTANEKARNAFIAKLQAKFGATNVRISPTKEVGKVLRAEAHITYNGTTMVLRLVTNRNNNPFANEEVDVNSLSMGRDRVVKAKKGLDVERIKTHIGARSFVALTGALTAAALDKLVAKGYTDSSRLRVGSTVRVLGAKTLLSHLSPEEQEGSFEILAENGSEYLLRMPDGLTPDGEAKGHTVHELGGVPGWWIPKSEVKVMAERKVLEVKVKETDVDHLPKDGGLRDPGKQRTFKVIREDVPGKRFLLEMPSGIGHKADTSDKDSWWVPQDACEITKQEGGEEEKKKMEAAKKAEEAKSAPSTFMDQLKSEAVEAAYISAGTQLAKGVRLAILTIVEKQLREKYNNDGIKGKKQNSAVQSALEGTRAMLDSDFGQAFIQSAIGHGLQYAPGIKDDPRAKILAQKMRVQGYATGMTAVLGVATEHLLPAVTSAFSSLPALPDIKLDDIASLPEVEQVSAGSSAAGAAHA